MRMDFMSCPVVQDSGHWKIGECVLVLQVFEVHVDIIVFSGQRTFFIVVPHKNLRHESKADCSYYIL